MLKSKLISFAGMLLLFLVVYDFVVAQTPPTPNGRRLREIVADKYQDRTLLIGGTTGSWAFGTPTGIIMDREFNYVTPENDFKQSYIHPDNTTWRWSRSDAWTNHVVANNQVLRIHGPVSPQCSNWAQSDIRTAEQLETNMRAFVEQLCKRYNAKTNFKYLDVINEVVQGGQWKKNEEGTGGWEMPWFIIGQDNDKNKTPLFIKYAFQVANEYAPDLSLVINQHEGTINKATWDLIFETVEYLRDSNLRVDGIGWQAHVDVGWEKIEGQQDALRELIDRAHANNLDFHITECNVFLEGNSPESFKAQAETFKAIMDIVVEKSASGLVTWNTWNIEDRNAWRNERYPTLFDVDYKAKPAYYAVQLALETKGDYTTKYSVKLNLKNTESGEAIPNSAITFNDETKTTNANGEAFFEVSAGLYDGRAEKRHFETKNFSSLSVYSDTAFTLSLDSAEVFYNVTFQVKDETDDKPLSAVTIGLNELVQSTGTEGELSFSVNPGNYTVQFLKDNYFNLDSVFAIQSDTTFVVTLKRSHGEVKFRLKNGSQPVNNALVVFNGDSLYTSALGFCTFRSVPVNNEYDFHIEREFFKTYEGSLTVTNDTTLTVQVEKTVANVEFNITSEGGEIQNPFVVLNNDTAWFDENLRARLYNIPVDFIYDFQILSGNFATYSDSFWLANDTTINLVIVYSSVNDFSGKTFTVYPNPADKFLTITSPDVKTVNADILNVSGFVVKQITLNAVSNRIDVSDLKNGMYFIRTKIDNQTEVSSFIIRH